MKKNIILSFIFLIFVTSSFFCFSQTKDSSMIEYLEFREVDIKDVLRQLAKQYNINIVFSESVTGIVTVQLHDISVDEAIDSIVTVNGFVYTKKGNIIKVTTSEEAEKEGKVTRLFKLNNADASELVETFKKVLTSEGAVKADRRSNSLIVTDTPSVVNQIEEMIPQLDKITPQVLIEAHFIETTLDTSEKLGIDWTMQATAHGSSRPTTAPFKAKGERGMNNLFPPLNPTDDDFYTKYGFPYAASSNFTFGILDFTEFTAIFNFIRSRQDSKIIANPRITTLDNQKALIQVGKDIPVPVYERNEQTGKMEISGWEDEPERVGVILEVTPQVSPDGHIRMRIKPEVSEIDRFLTIEGDEVRPITNTRTAETEVQIRDGQTVVIGGLVKTKTTRSVKKVPILGDIPFLGLLFTRKEEGSDENPSEKIDLLIFVTARILKDTNEPLIGYKNHLITAPPKPFKLKPRSINIKK